MNLVYQDHANRILQGDCLDLEQQLGPNCVDLIVTSPPYNLDIAYAEGGDKADPITYFSFLEETAAVLWDVSKEGGRLCLNIPLDVNKPYHVPFYQMALTSFIAAGWTYRSTIVWNEQNISKRTAWGSWCSSSAPNVISPVEMIAVFYKGDWKRTSTEKSDITPTEFKEWVLGHWTFPGASSKKIGHPAPFPEELVKRCIKLFSYPGDLILDPFLGSGTTFKVATALGRSCVGVDISQDYCELAMARCNK